MKVIWDEHWMLGQTAWAIASNWRAISEPAKWHLFRFLGERRLPSPVTRRGTFSLSRLMAQKWPWLLLSLIRGPAGAESTDAEPLLGQRGRVRLFLPGRNATREHAEALLPWNQGGEHGCWWKDSRSHRVKAALAECIPLKNKARRALLLQEFDPLSKAATALTPLWWAVGM